MRQVDSSLLDEWEKLAAGGDGVEDGRPPLDGGARGRHPQRPGLPGAGAQRAVPPRGAGRAARAGTCSASWTARRAGTRERWRDALEPYFAEHADIGTGPDARGPQFLTITEEPQRWLVRQVLDDPAGDRDWAITAEVDLAASDEEGAAVVWVTAVEPLGGLPVARSRNGPLDPSCATCRADRDTPSRGR